MKTKSNMTVKEVNKFGKFMGDSIEMKRIIKIGKFILFKTK